MAGLGGRAVELGAAVVNEPQPRLEIVRRLAPSPPPGCRAPGNIQRGEATVLAVLIRWSIQGIRRVAARLTPRHIDPVASSQGHEREGRIKLPRKSPTENRQGSRHLNRRS